MRIERSRCGEYLITPAYKGYESDVDEKRVNIPHMVPLLYALLDKYGPEAFRREIEFVNVPEDEKALLKKVMSLVIKTITLEEEVRGLLWYG